MSLGSSRANNRLDTAWTDLDTRQFSSITPLQAGSAISGFTQQGTISYEKTLLPSTVGDDGSAGNVKIIAEDVKNTVEYDSDAINAVFYIDKYNGTYSTTKTADRYPYIRAIKQDSNGVTIGDPLQIVSYGCWETGFVYLGNRKYLVTYGQNGPNYRIFAKVVTRSEDGLTFTAGSEYRIGTSDTYATESITRLSEDTAMIVTRDYDNSNEYEAWIITVSGTSISVGSPFVLTTLHSNMSTAIKRVEGVDSTHAVYFSRDYGTPDQIYATPLSVSGTTISAGTPVSIASSSNATYIMFTTVMPTNDETPNEPKVVCGWIEYDYSIEESVLNVSLVTHNVGTNTITDEGSVTIADIDDGTGNVVYGIWGMPVSPGQVLISGYTMNYTVGEEHTGSIGSVVSVDTGNTTTLNKDWEGYLSTTESFADVDDSGSKFTFTSFDNNSKAYMITVLYNDTVNNSGENLGLQSVVFLNGDK